MKKLLPLCVLVLCLDVRPAHAATLQIDATGLLTGATGVLVNGIAHDVRFQAGSCNVVFNGCDPAEDLFFTASAAALAASQALLDQVFLGTNPGNIDPMTPGLFDDHASLTQGCTLAGFNVCETLTPYGFRNGIELLAGIAFNYGPVTGQADVAALGSIGGGGVPTSGIQTFAVWSLSPVVVPEPSTLALLATGLGVSVRRLRRRAPGVR